MNHKTLLKISITIAVIGIFSLLILANALPIKQYKIKDINNNLIEKKIQVQGQITNIKSYKESDFQVITLNDDTGNIDITIDNIQNLTKNKTIVVIGKVKTYKKDIQIQADKIISK